MEEKKEVIIDSVIVSETDADSGKETQKETDNSEQQNGKKDDGMKKLMRSKGNRMICGVCAGFGDYFGMDATIVRLLFLLFGCTGTGILAYFIAAAVIPEEE